jgi:hypothetical protein
MSVRDDCFQRYALLRRSQGSIRPAVIDLIVHAQAVEIQAVVMPAARSQKNSQSFCSEGTSDNSPAIYRRDQVTQQQVP